MRTILTELERAFDTLNQRLFAGGLRRPEFILLPRKRGVVKYLAESGHITVGGDLANADAVGVLAKLLHEMVHISNAMKGITDCRLTRSTQYHNKHFRDAALDVGLAVSKHPTRGWEITTITTIKKMDGNHALPTSEAVDRRVAAFDAVSLDKAVLRQAKADILAAYKEGRQVKYTLKYQCNCPPPHNSIRSGRRPHGDYPLNVRCLDCNSIFVCVDHPPKN